MLVEGAVPLDELVLSYAALLENLSSEVMSLGKF